MRFPVQQSHLRPETLSSICSYRKLRVVDVFVTEGEDFLDLFGVLARFVACGIDPECAVEIVERLAPLLAAVVPPSAFDEQRVVARLLADAFGEPFGVADGVPEPFLADVGQHFGREHRRCAVALLQCAAHLGRGEVAQRRFVQKGDPVEVLRRLEAPARVDQQRIAVEELAVVSPALILSYNSCILYSKEALNYGY